MLTTYLLKVVFTYAFLNFPFRITLHYLLFGKTEATTLQHVAETFIPFAIALGIACLVRNVAIVFSFVGSVARTAVFFLFPAVLYLRSRKLAPTRSSVLTVMCYGFLVVGVTALALGIAASARNASRSQ